MKLLNKIADSIDDSRIVKQAYRVLYYILGILNGCCTIGLSVYIYCATVNLDIFEFNTWSKIVFMFLYTVYTIILIISGVVIYLYWKKHGDAIGSSETKYHSNFVLADVIQTFNKSYVFMSLVTIISGCVLLYLGLILTGEADFYQGETFLLATGILIAVILSYIIIVMFITMFVNFITDKIKQKEQISDALSDIADVMRSSEVGKEEVKISDTKIITCPDSGKQVPSNMAKCPNCDSSMSVITQEEQQKSENQQNTVQQKVTRGKHKHNILRSFKTLI
ncbi:MAG: hypothetical protein IKQ46_10860 [Bacteroidales bacterium]|nr:hypothetical protein [Bacteroidales bacterium]